MNDRPMARIRRALLASAGLALLLGANHASAESLADAWAKAYGSNPQIAAERARLRTIDEGVPQAKSGWRPTVTLEGQTGVQYIEQETAFANTDDTIYPSSITGSVSQPLYRGGRTTADTARAEAEVRAGRAALGNVVQQVLLAAGTAYMDVLRDEAVVNLNENNVRVLERQLQATNDRFSVGEVTRTDVAQAESRLARSKADLKTAEGDLETSRAAYTRQVGEPPASLSAPSAIMGVPETLDAAVTRAAVNNPVVRQAMELHQSSRHTVDLITGELYPQVALNGTLQQSFDTSANVQETRAAQATVDLTVPLYQSGSVYARVRGAKNAESQRLQQIEDARRQAIEQATQAWEQTVANRSRIVSLESEIRANEIALEGVQQEALVGTRTVLDILDAEQDLLDSRVNLVRARRDEFVAVFGLLTAVGDLNPQAMDLNVEVYDPTRYYNAVKDQWFGTTPQQ